MCTYVFDLLCQDCEIIYLSTALRLCQHSFKDLWRLYKRQQWPTNDNRQGDQVCKWICFGYSSKKPSDNVSCSHPTKSLASDIGYILRKLNPKKTMPQKSITLGKSFLGSFYLFWFISRTGWQSLTGIENFDMVFMAINDGKRFADLIENELWAMSGMQDKIHPLNQR